MPCGLMAQCYRICRHQQQSWRFVIPKMSWAYLDENRIEEFAKYHLENLRFLYREADGDDNKVCHSGQGWWEESLNDRLGEHAACARIG